MKILANQMTEASFARNEWVVDANVSRAEMLDKNTWAHVAFRLRRGARISVLAADSSWCGDYIVRSIAEGGEVVIGELNYREFEAVERDAAEYRVEWVNPTIKHRVVRVSDGAIIKEGIASKAAAAAFLAEPLIDKAA